MGSKDPADLPVTEDELHEMLNSRFGKTFIKRLQEWRSLRQKPDQSIRQYYDTIQRASLGLRRSPEEIVDKFLSTLRDEAIHVQLVNHQFDNLRSALEAAER